MDDELKKLIEKRNEYSFFIKSLAITIISITAGSLLGGYIIGSLTGKLFAWLYLGGLGGVTIMLNKFSELKRLIEKREDIEYDIASVKRKIKKNSLVSTNSITNGLNKEKSQDFGKMINNIEKETESKYGFKFNENEIRNTSYDNTEGKKR